jgi:hypothetical protein
MKEFSQKYFAWYVLFRKTDLYHDLSFEIFDHLGFSGA